MAAGTSPPGSAGGGTRPVDVVPVPAAIFGPLLERVTDVTTLRCALRAVFVLHRKQGRPSVVTARELADDPVLGLGGDEPAAERALESLAELGVLLRASTGDGGAGYCMDTPANRRALSATGARADGALAGRDADGAARWGCRGEAKRLPHIRGERWRHHADGGRAAQGHGS